MVKRIVGLTAIIIVTIACSLTGLQAIYKSTPKAVSQLLITPNPYATITPTPFQPIEPTPTAEPIQAQGMDGAGSIPGMPTTSPFLTNSQIPEGQVHILLFGSDWRPSSGYRTDTIVLVAINPTAGTVSAVSFPRDLYVTIPGYETNRINTAMPHGFNVVQDTFYYNFGVRPDFYVMTNFQGFVQIVNTLGGIDVQASQQLSDRCQLSWASYDGYCTVGPGPIHLDGDSALWYVRSRYSTNDFDRGRRSQEIIKAMFNRLMALDVVNKLPEMFEIYRQNVETNLTLEIVTPLAQLAPHIFENDMLIRSFAIGSDHVTPYRIPESGAQVLIPNMDAISSIIHQAFFK